MKQVELMVRPRWLIPVEPHDTVLEEHALVVDQGRIVDLLPADFAAQQYQAAEVIELPDHALMPGLVNAHTHAAMSLLRGLADDLPLMRWLQEHIWPAEGAHVSEEFCRQGTQLACAEMIRGGTTCFNDMYFFPQITAQVAADAGMRAMVGLIVLDFPTVWAQNADEYIHKGVEVHDQLRNEALIRTCFAPHAPYSVSDAPLQKIRALANELNLPIHMHLHETADEVAGSIEQHGQRPWARISGLGLPGPDLMAVHMTQLEDDEIAACAAAGTHVLHCPESNLKLASGFCPVAKLLDAGVNVALGTDGAASNNDLDMLGEMRSAALLAKGVSGDATAVSAAQALEMATINGARALGMDDQIGSLLPGKAADFIALRLNDVSTQPLYNVISQVVYAAHRGLVSEVFVAGKALLRDGELQTIDEAQLLTQAAAWRARIAA